MAMAFRFSDGNNVYGQLKDDGDVLLHFEVDFEQWQRIDDYMLIFDLFYKL
jgi:hypothetical protein